MFETTGLTVSRLIRVRFSPIIFAKANSNGSFAKVGAPASAATHARTGKTEHREAHTQQTRHRRMKPCRKTHLMSAFGVGRDAGLTGREPWFDVVLVRVVMRKIGSAGNRWRSTPKPAGTKSRATWRSAAPRRNAAKPNADKDCAPIWRRADEPQRWRDGNKTHAQAAGDAERSDRFVVIRTGSHGPPDRVK